MRPSNHQLISWNHHYRSTSNQRKRVFQKYTKVCTVPSVEVNWSSQSRRPDRSSSTISAYTTHLGSRCQNRNCLSGTSEQKYSKRTVLCLLVSEQIIWPSVLRISNQMCIRSWGVHWIKFLPVIESLGRQTMLQDQPSASSCPHKYTPMNKPFEMPMMASA